jgi:hypothetical protein
MTLRDLTIEESFPIAFHQDLLKKQSEHFVNNSIANGAIEGGYKNIPTELPPNNIIAPLMINSKPPNLLIGTYIKKNWRVILTSRLIGGVVWYFLDRNIKKARLRKKIKI